MASLTEENKNRIIEEIRELKKSRNAVILAHYYQEGEIQDLADFVGDSLQLAQQAAKTEADVIVFCGVHFMAESAAILSPEKIVLLPDEKAGCPMADMIDAQMLREEKERIPGVKVVCYVNSSAEVKAESDVCCTSSNAEKIIKAVPEEEILFVPDGNLGKYIAAQTGKRLHFWPGFCPTHHNLRREDILQKRAEYPQAEVLVHPECREEVWREADYVGSTAGIIRYARESDSKEFIIGTECGILHQLQKGCPDKVFYLASRVLLCPNMKKITLQKVRDSLYGLSPRITVSEEIANKAIHALEQMLSLSK
ncbi:quinolinate synthetase A [Syntrophobotulus glycolicus DSM 8271]|uniref:Quinolinate synthase n=1 Tax=Syntrophobotulus glycolicus (strain DSM 8271 / FlGlyR) TaxID=645991 RepID=F0SWA6_SYNGF|nr:quinolinate synthase NadA [Syntrophobotulus glycolicus]ADY54592.1 quinolinate synthetase A [Syntrophobotulus glycolicus DSM 8271]